MISNQKLIELYTLMVKCRMVGERKGQALSSNSASAKPNSGWEATFAGVIADLDPEDSLYPLNASFASELQASTHREKSAGGDGNFSSIPPVNSVSSSWLPPSATPADLTATCVAAKTHKASKTGKIAVHFSSTEISNPRHWEKTLSLASRQNLPVLFVCHDLSHEEVMAANGARANTPTALAFGVPIIHVDSNDVVAVYRVASESIARARQHRGPTIIASSPGHTFNSSINGAPIHRQPQSRDPLLTMEAYLRSKKLFKPQLRLQIQTGVQQEFAAATGFMTN